MSRELLKRALDALGTSTWDHTRAVGKQELIDALREALAAPQPEPVAWKCAKCGNTSDCEGVTVGDNWCNSCAVCGEMKPLYATAPPAAPAPAVPEVMAGPMPPMSEADEKRLNAALTIVFDLACGPADPTMMQDELVAAAESIDMRFPAPAVPDDATILAEHLTRALKANGDLSASLSKARGMVLELDSVLRMAESHNDGKTTAASIRAACEPYLPLSAAPAVPLTDDMVEVEFVSRGDDKGQGLHPYWKSAFREGWHFARAMIAASPPAPAVAEPLSDERIDEIFEGAHENMPKGVLFRTFIARAIEQAHGIGGGGK